MSKHFKISLEPHLDGPSLSHLVLSGAQKACHAAILHALGVQIGIGLGPRIPKTLNLTGSLGRSSLKRRPITGLGLRVCISKSLFMVWLVWVW